MREVFTARGSGKTRDDALAQATVAAEMYFGENFPLVEIDDIDAFTGRTFAGEIVSFEVEVTYVYDGAFSGGK